MARAKGPPPGAKRASAVEAALKRAQACVAAGNATEAVQVIEAALDAAPADPGLLTGLGVAQRFAGNYDAAAGTFERVLAAHPDRADAAVFLGMVRLAQGRQQEGWALYAARWRAPGWTEKPRYPAESQWQGRVSRGTRLLLWGEQGFGDTLQFCRYSPWLQSQFEPQGASVALEVPVRLHRLLAGAWPGVEVIRAGEAAGRFDAHLALMDLPLRWGQVGGEGGLPYLPEPYLQAPGPARGENTGVLKVPGPRGRKQLRVGIAWQGRASNPDDATRSIAPGQLKALFEVPGIRWVSLQKKDTGRSTGIPSWLGEDPSADLAETANLIAGLDLVISVDTAVAHLAGALGKPLWLLLGNVADWRWGLAGESTPWYPGARLIRRAAGEGWQQAVMRVAKMLAALAHEPDPHAAARNSDNVSNAGSTEDRRMATPSTEMQHTSAAQEAPHLEITTSRQMLAWMAEQKLSLAVTTYQIGKLFLFGLKDNGELSVFERTFNRCMGLCPTANGFYMSSLHQVWRFENLFTNGETQDGYDRLYLPQVGNTTGDLDIHDMAVNADGRVVFVNTLFGCLATLSETHSFRPLWRPPFISKLAAEDRCHLNGLAMRDGRAAYVTAVGESDVVDGWRDHRAGGGVVIDVNTNEIVCRGLSMPHSPRWHQGKLWLLNSGTGDFGHVDPQTGRFVPVAFCAGYMRGLYFHGDYALVGLSRPRHNKTFSGLALDENLKSRKAEPRCGVQVIDLRSGDAVHWLRFEGVVEELYDVITLPGVRRPMALGFKTDEIRRVLSVEE